MEGVVRSAACGRVESVVRVAACGRARGVVREGTGQLGEAQLVTLRWAYKPGAFLTSFPHPNISEKIGRLTAHHPSFTPLIKIFAVGRRNTPATSPVAADEDH